MTVSRRLLLGSAPLLAPLLAMPSILRAQDRAEVSFMFPVAVGGPITKIIDGYAADYEREHGTKVRPIYAGSYGDTLVKAQTALKSGNGPTMAVLLSTDVYTLIDDELIVPFEDLGDAGWLQAFYPAFLRNTQIGGKNWGVPFQRSTIVMYYNKQLLQAAGLDPEQPPANWADNAAIAAKLSKPGERWGIAIPGTGFTYWLFQALVAEAGGDLANADGTKVSYDTPETRSALHYWLDLQKSGATPPGLVDWGTTPRDFLESRAAMVWTTTGNLSNIRKSAGFPFGVAMLPEGKRRGSPTGGGNFYLFKSASPAQRESALRFMQWITSPERAAQWGIDTGYVATRPDSWETAAMKRYVADFPAAAVARDQLGFAVPELSTHDNQRVSEALNVALQGALTGQREPDAALASAQATATRLLARFR